LLPLNLQSTFSCSISHHGRRDATVGLAYSPAAAVSAADPIRTGSRVLLQPAYRLALAVPLHLNTDLLLIDVTFWQG